MFEEQSAFNEEANTDPTVSTDNACGGQAVCEIAPPMVHATVARDAKGDLKLIGQGAIPVLQAVSCLVRPEPGDRVRALLDEGCWVVVDILRRESASDPLVVDGGQRALRIRSNSVVIRASHALRLSAPKLFMRSGEAHETFGNLHTIADRLTIDARSSRRTIAELDATQASHIMQHAHQTLAMRGRIGSITADSLLKIDGAQVHMG